jgi:coniferyl-aldehyde dehydrogenase
MTPAAEVTRLTSVLERQRASFLRDGPPPLAARRDALKKLKEAILAREDDFAAALNQDFGHRSKEESLLFDVASTVSSINYLHGNLARFMRPEHRDVAWIFKPGKNRVIYQPLGVVGILSPWNYPVGLSLIPLATALAAGNRAMLKPSEFVSATTALTAQMLAEIFPEEQVAVATGDAKIGSAFTALPFDYMLFTGSIPVGKAVMRAASDNLVPVTLELGGKSPVIVAAGYDLQTAAHRIAYGKLANGGQTCVAPDYVLAPEGEVEAFATAFKQEAARLYPNIADNPDYTWIVSDHHFERLSGLLADAKAKGARVIDIGGTRGGGGSRNRGCSCPPSCSTRPMR